MDKTGTPYIVINAENMSWKIDLGLSVWHANGYIFKSAIKALTANRETQIHATSALIVFVLIPLRWCNIRTFACKLCGAE